MLHCEFFQEFSGHRGGVYRLVPGQEDIFYSVAGDGVVAQWELGSSTATALLQTDSPIFAAYIAQEQQLFFAGQQNGILQILSLQTRKIVQKISLSAPIYDIRVIHNQLWVACGKGFCAILDLNNFEKQHTIQLNNQNIRTILPILGKQQVAISGSNGKIYFLDPNNYHILQEWQAAIRTIFTLVEKPASNLPILYSGGLNAVLNRWCINPINKEVEISAHLFAINQIIIIPEFSLLVSASSDKSFKIWDLETLTLLKVIDPTKPKSHIASINTICWLPNAQMLVTAGDDKRILSWKIYRNQHNN